MVDILYEQFEPDIANNIRKFLQTPEAAMIKAYWTLVRKFYRFDNATRWYEWNRIDYVLKKNQMRFYRTFSVPLWYSEERGRVAHLAVLERFRKQ